MVRMVIIVVAITIITIKQRLTSCRNSQLRILKVLIIKGLVVVVRKGLELVLITIVLIIIITIVILIVTKLHLCNSSIIFNSRTHHKNLAQHKFTALKSNKNKSSKNNKSNNKNKNNINTNKESNK